MENIFDEFTRFDTAEQRISELDEGQKWPPKIQDKEKKNGEAKQKK
jgi:hypothetical protein